MAEPRAVVDVVGAHDHAREFLDHVAVFVRRLGRGESAEAATVAREAVGGGVQRLVPRDRKPLAVTLDQRRGDAIARVDEAGAEAALDAEGAQAREIPRHVVRHHREPAVPPDLERDAAADAAVRAGRLDFARDGSRGLLRPQCARGAGGDALAAGGAYGGRHEAVARDPHPHVVATADQRDGADQLDVIAGRGAATAEYAGLAIEHEEALGCVHRKAMMRRMAGGGERMLRGRFADLTEAAAAIAWAEHRPREIEHRATGLDGIGMRGLDHHAVARGQVTRGGQAALPLDMDEAGAARAEGRAVWILAKL